MIDLPRLTSDQHIALNDAYRKVAAHLQNTIDIIDDQLGDGYAESHPELIGAVMQAAATHYSSWSDGVCADRLCKQLDGICETLVDLYSVLQR